MRHYHVVLLKSGSSLKGGLEGYTNRLIKAFRMRGHFVTLLTSGPVNSSGDYNKVSLCPQSKMSFFHLRSFDKACKKWLVENHADIVFGMDRNSTQTHYRAGNGVHAAYLKRRALDEGFFKSLTFRFNPLHQSILSLEKKTYESPLIKKIFTNSNMVKEEILRHYETDPKKIETIHNGVDFNESEHAFNTPIKDRPNAHQFLFIGHGWHRKGLSYLLTALSYIKQENFHLQVIGKDHNAKYYESQAETLGLRKKVSFLGISASVIPFLQQADTLIVPSTYDPFANVTLEGLAMGVFVVTSRYNGASELINKENGLVINDLYDPIEFSSCLKYALNRPKTTESAEIIRNSIRPYSIENQLSKLIESTLNAT